MADLAIESIMNPRRLYLLLKKDFVMGYQGLLVGMAAAAGGIFVLSVASMLVSRGPIFYPFFFTLLLYLGGWIFAASVFKELHQPGSGSFLISLPGSTLEKFVSKLLVSAVGYPVGVAAFVAAVSALTEIVNRALFGAGHLLFDPFSIDTLQSLAFFAMTQAVFLLGSVWFRKMAFIKTALSLIVLCIGFATFAGVLFGLLFSDLLKSAASSPQVQEALGRVFKSAAHGGTFIDLSNSDLIPQNVWTVLKIGVAPVCWVIAYLRLSETEV